MTKACRTCTQAITSNEYFCLDGSSYVSSTLQIKHLLQCCIPDFDLELVPNSAICRNCMSALHIAYCFKQETMKNEEAFRRRQHIRIKNFDALAKGSLGELQPASGGNEYKAQKVEAFEVELTDINDLKVEFVYEDADDANDVEILAEDKGSVDGNINGSVVGKSEEQVQFCDDDDDIKPTKCSPVVPYDDRFHLLEDLGCDVSLHVVNENLPVASEAIQQASSKVERVVACSKDNAHFLQQIDSTNDQRINLKDVSGKSEVDLTNVTSYITRTSCSNRKIRNVKRPYKCNECNFQTDARASLNMHKRIHTGEKPFHCTKCSYKAKRKAHLEDHMKIHTGERPYRCPSCGKCFITKQIMKKHARIHTGEKPYECMQCNYRSRHKLSIANHVKKVHIGVSKLTDHKPSVCYICGKCLSGPASLSTHMRIHTGVKSHLCELCGRYFREKGMLQNHMRTHTGEKPFKCSDCDYIATRKAHLQDHMRTHVGRIELVQCTECGKRYATKLLLKKHMKENHKTEIAQEAQQFSGQFYSNC